MFDCRLETVYKVEWSPVCKNCIFNHLSRFMSYVDENRDILTRLGWSSDPLLLWEKDIGQKLKPGQLCDRRGNRVAVTEEVPTGESLSLFCGSTIQL